MTDKEKQIEEIARIIHFDYWGACGADSCSNCSHNVLNICNDKIIAEKLYNKLFPECSVVLSKEEWETLHNDYAKALYNARCDERKETAREFAKGICKMLWNRGKDRNGKTFDYGDITSIDVYELAKQFGVEVDSEKENKSYPLHYVDIDCPKCGRHRVELYDNGKHICEKCLWCIEDEKYYWENDL